VCDDCIVDGVRQALKASGYCHLAKLSALSQEGCVTLLGTVPSYYLKQVAQAVLEPVPGIRGINNRLVVVTRK
jgi:osmotically-inducible protein OsmY